MCKVTFFENSQVWGKEILRRKVVKLAKTFLHFSRKTIFKNLDTTQLLLING